MQFPNKKEFSYILGDHNKNEPELVGVKCENISIQLSPNLNDVLLGDIEIKREELIAFMLATGIYDDIRARDNRQGITLDITRSQAYDIGMTLTGGKTKALKKKIFKLIYEAKNRINK
tara:strand:- start:835 stop:1188 length:354 start_codon:yes stop_codon:yes gene_type:complete